MSRLNTLYPNDTFLKNISNAMGKIDSKNETQIKQEIEQIGYKEFYRYYNEKSVYIKQLQQENQQLKIQISAREENYKKLEVLVECLKLGVTLNQEQEELLDKILFERGVSDE